MKKFDLNAYGVEEMCDSQTREVNGGDVVVFALIALGFNLFAAAYKMGADRAAIDAANSK